MKYPYFRGLEADRYSFYRVPKALIKVDLFEKMSGDAKLLYKGYTANLVFRLYRSDGSAVEKLHTAWTHKGRKFLYHELKRRGILPMAEQEG